jgi:hypothetical protein
MKIAHDHPETKPFVEAVGKLIQNMGMIEIQTYDWIAGLQTDPMVLELARRSKFRDRVEIIKKMIQRQECLAPERKARLIDLWVSVLPHSEVRNLVAHSCVVLGFPNEDPTQPAFVKGIVNLRPRDKTREAELISVEEINGSVNASVRIAAALLEATNELKADPHADDAQRNAQSARSPGQA